jgi:hypothetical protein
MYTRDRGLISKQFQNRNKGIPLHSATEQGVSIGPHLPPQIWGKLSQIGWSVYILLALLHNKTYGNIFIY